VVPFCRIYAVQLKDKIRDLEAKKEAGKVAEMRDQKLGMTMLPERSSGKSDGYRLTRTVLNIFGKQFID